MDNQEESDLLKNKEFLNKKEFLNNCYFIYFNMYNNYFIHSFRPIKTDFFNSYLYL
jgi:hypothetical protein